MCIVTKLQDRSEEIINQWKNVFERQSIKVTIGHNRTSLPFGGRLGPNHSIFDSNRYSMISYCTGIWFKWSYWCISNDGNMLTNTKEINLISSLVWLPFIERRICIWYSMDTLENAVRNMVWHHWLGQCSLVTSWYEGCDFFFFFYLEIVLQSVSQLYLEVIFKFLQGREIHAGLISFQDLRFGS